MTKTTPIYKGPIADAESVSKTVSIVTGNSNPEMAKETCQFLGLPLCDATVSKFTDGETKIQVNEGVRGRDVYIIQPVCRHEGGSVNDALMELVLLISTMRRANAKNVIAVITYFGYARQDRKMTSRVPISAADVATVISSVGVDRVISIDLHCGQIQGFFPPRVPVDNLTAGHVGAYYFAERTDLQGPVVVSPDSGGVNRAKEFRQILEKQGHEDAGLAMIIKNRAVIADGSMENKDCIIVDDMVDTAGTLCEAAEELKRHGASRIFVFITHGLLNGPAIERIQQSEIDELVVTNTVALPVASKTVEKIKQLSIAPFLAETLRRTILNESLGEGMFE